MRAVNQLERQNAILHVLYARRSDRIANLAEEFGVSIRTIKYDIETLSCSYPIETVRGRHGGCVKVADWYHPTRSSLCPEQMALLKKLAPSLSGDDLTVMNSIISQFSPG